MAVIDIVDPDEVQDIGDAVSGPLRLLKQLPSHDPEPLPLPPPALIFPTSLIASLGVCAGDSSCFHRPVVSNAA